MEHFAGRSPRSRSGNAPAHQYTKTGPDLGELSKALHTKVSEGQQPKLRSGDSISNVLGKIYNLFLINSKADSDARDDDKQKKIEENELRDKRNEELIHALTGTGMAVPVKEKKKEEGKSFFEIIGSMISGLIGTIKGMINTALAPFKWLLELNWLKGIGSIASIAGRMLPFITPLLPAILAVLVGAAIAYGGKLLLDKMAQFHTGDPNATAESVVVDAVEQIGERFFGIKTTETLDNEQFFNDTINAATKNNNSISQESKENLLSKEWVKNDPRKVTRLNQLTVIPKQNISAIEQEGKQLPAEGQGAYNIGPVKANASTGVMSVKVNRRRQTSDTSATTPTSPTTTETPSLSPVTATPTSPEPSSIASRMIDATTNNTETKLNENTSPKMISIDNSKKMSVGSSAPAIGMDSSVSVRIDDPTLQKLQKQNLRTV
jgi:hypothetical protein